ncbi:hypothetical protein BKA69DRAFT_1061367 [Paraphysoderma sedebokerense]|nr:hypothetical protein BKA69DRAFT_1061367 [Paraphysoderma sedebokerense]
MLSNSIHTYLFACIFLALTISSECGRTEIMEELPHARPHIRTNRKIVAFPPPLSNTVFQPSPLKEPFQRSFRRAETVRCMVKDRNIINSVEFPPRPIAEVITKGVRGFLNTKVVSFILDRMQPKLRSRVRQSLSSIKLNIITRIPPILQEQAAEVFRLKPLTPPKVRREGMNPIEHAHVTFEEVGNVIKVEMIKQSDRYWQMVEDDITETLTLSLYQNMAFKRRLMRRDDLKMKSVNLGCIAEAVAVDFAKINDCQMQTIPQSTAEGFAQISRSVLQQSLQTEEATSAPQVEGEAAPQLEQIINRMSKELEKEVEAKAQESANEMLLGIAEDLVETMIEESNQAKATSTLSGNMDSQSVVEQIDGLNEKFKGISLIGEDDQSGILKCLVSGDL